MVLGMMFAGLLFLMLVLGSIVLVIIFWLWMLVDCLKRKFEDKMVWVFVLVFTWLLGAILYYFLVYRKKR